MDQKRDEVATARQWSALWKQAAKESRAANHELAEMVTERIMRAVSLANEMDELRTQRDALIKAMKRGEIMSTTGDVPGQYPLSWDAWDNTGPRNETNNSNIMDIVSRLHEVYHATEEPYPPAVWDVVVDLVQAWDGLLKQSQNINNGKRE